MVANLGFLGDFEYRIDSKGRIPLPPRFRPKLSGGGVISYGWDKCIAVYPVSEWTKRAEALAGLPEMRSKVRHLSRFLFGGAFPFELDAQGRIALPAVLREYAEIKNVVILAGRHSFLEVWSKELWEREIAAILPQVAQLWESLERRE